MKKMILVLMMLFSTTVFSKDSSWLLCSNKYLAINVFEHRNQSGDGRETELKFLYGMNLLTGILIEENSDSVILSGPDQYINTFKGNVNIDYPNWLTIKGIFKLYGDIHPLDTKMRCQEMDGTYLPDNK